MSARAIDAVPGPDAGAGPDDGPGARRPPWHGRPYSIARDGVSIANCEEEPVRTPGCIQAHGAMLALSPEDLVILQASANTAEHLGASPDALRGRTADAVLGEDGARRLRELLARDELRSGPLYVTTLERGDGAALDASAHLAGDSVLLELEASGRTDDSVPDYHGAVQRSVARLQEARTLDRFADTLAEEVRALTGLDRTMVYRFHPDFHGEVVAEARREDLAPLLGLHYPASDIPRQVREMFGHVWVRPLVDAGAAPVEMEPLADPRTGAPLDMSLASLRGASVMYTEYLANMGVTATLVMPLLKDGELWGLVACHHHAPKRFDWRVRAACEFLARMASLQLRAVEDREHFVYRLELEGVHSRLVARASRSGELASLVDGPTTLLDAIEAGGVALLQGGAWHTAGDVPPLDALDALGRWLGTREELAGALSGGPAGGAFATDALGEAYPPATAWAEIASGLLAVSVGPAGGPLALWFRPEATREIRWAGAPDDKPTVAGPHGPRLTPRASFDLYVESVRGRSAPWKPVEVQAALGLRALLAELVIERAEALSEVNVELSRSNDELDSFAYVASHDLKEPLRGISKYAHQLLAGTAEADRENRLKLESLMRLTARMDALLDSLLHYSRVGRVSLEPLPEDLGRVLEEALEITAARREDSGAEIVLARALPTLVCDRVRVREIYVNLLTNAMKYNDRPVARIELSHLAPGEQDAPTRERSGGRTVLRVSDDGIGMEERHLAPAFEMFRRLHARDAYGGGTGTGLPIVRRLVERHGGRVWIDSAPGRGTTVSFTLQAPEPGR